MFNPDVIAAVKAANDMLLRGFTSVRDLGGPIFGLKSGIDDGLAAALGLDPLPQARDRDPEAGPSTLVLVTPKAHHFLNSSFVNHERLRRAAGQPLVHLSPADAAAREVADGDRVALANGSGCIEVDARVSEDVAAGTAMLLSNWWHADIPGGSGANLLTDQDPNDLGGGPVFASRVSVRRL